MAFSQGINSDLWHSIVLVTSHSCDAPLVLTLYGCHRCLLGALGLGVYFHFILLFSLLFFFFVVLFWPTPHPVEEWCMKLMTSSFILYSISLSCAE